MIFYVNTITEITKFRNGENILGTPSRCVLTNNIAFGVLQRLHLFTCSSFFAFQVVKGKDLPGAINVLPAGLGEVLKKRESREFKMEVNINNLVSMKYFQSK